MGIDPTDLMRINRLPVEKLRHWMDGQKPESPFHLAAKYERARRETRDNWIKWGVGVGIAVAGIVLSLHK